MCWQFIYAQSFILSRPLENWNSLGKYVPAQIMKLQDEAGVRNLIYELPISAFITSLEGYNKLSNTLTLLMEWLEEILCVEL